MRVAYQAGVLVALEEAGLRFDHVDGASGGTMNLSMLLGGQGSTEIAARWRSLDPRGFSTLLPLRDYALSPRWPGLGSGSGLRDKVFPHLGIEPERIREMREIDGTYNVCNFSTKAAEVVEHRDIDLDLLVAAVSLPVLMPAVVRAGTAYTDAVWIRDSNVPEAVRRGSDDIWLVWCIGNTPAYHRGSFRQYVHMIEMAANGSLLGDLAYLEARWPERPIQIHVIKPRRPLPLDPAYYLGRIDAATLIDLGYQDACRYLDAPTPLSAPFPPTITAMEEGTPGAAGRLQLAGSFAADTDDSATRAAGDRVDGPIRLHLQVQTKPGARHGEPLELQVAGDVSVPAAAAHTLLDEGEATLDPVAGLHLRLSWRSPAGRSSLVAHSNGGEELSVTMYAGAGDQPRTVTGSCTLRFTWQEMARTLVSVRATDATSTLQATRERVALATALLRAARPRPASLPGPALPPSATTGRSEPIEDAVRPNLGKG